MMQQSMCQQDQNMSNQQQAMGQQMVLCPVRFVYETQILMQPGEHMQSNQAILINPQNTPPWIQNRQVQNQIVYVHQVPNNIMPSVQQHIDQNQLYMQQIANYQMPQMIQNQEQIRPNIQMMQMTNVGSNMQIERHVGQTNNQMTPNQILVPNRQMVNVGNQNTIYAQSELQRQLFMNVRPVNQTRPVQANAVQNMNAQQMNAGMPVQQNIGQTYNPNTRVRPQIQQIKTEVVERTEVANNTHIITQSNVITPPRTVQNYYKPIQPRPQYRAVYTSTVTQTPMTQPNNQPNKIIPNQLTPKVNYYVNNTDSNTFNRKRKSESPDEVQKKMSMHALKTPETLKYGSMVVKSIPTSIDVGVNTSPVHKRHARNQNPQIIIPIKSQEVKKSPEIKISPVVNNTQASDNKIIVVPKTEQKTVMNTTETFKLPEVPQDVTVDDKLRKTVYIQARGRVLNDKELRPNSIENMQQNLDDFNKMQRISDDVKNVIQIVSDKSSEQFNDFVKPEVPVNRTENKKEDLKDKIKDEISAPVIETKKEQSNEIEMKNEKQFLLTHVLDGFVIQESNMAFPIRKPLKEKPVQGNTQDLEEQQNTETELKEESNDDKVDAPVIPFHTLQLNNEKKNDASEEENIDNPFGSLQQSTVKKWTVEQITSHLAKYDWSETVSLLQDQEIDGMSLFLVTKSQLLNIGVKESHADMICEFVKC